MLDNLLSAVRIRGEISGKAVQGGRHRVEPRQQQQVTDVEDLVAGALLPVDLGPKHPAQDVLPRPAFALVEDLVDVVVAALAGAIAQVRGLGEVVGLHLRAQDGVLDFEERVQVFVGKADQRQEDCRR